MRFIPFFFNLGFVGTFKEAVADSLDCIREKYDIADLKSISDEFRLISKEWEIARSIIMRKLANPSDNISIMRAAERIMRGSYVI